MSDDYLYPFDPTGKLASNRIPNEPHNLSASAWADYFFIVPDFAPFFRGDSLKVVHKLTGKELKEGIDYHCTHFFHAASHQTLTGVYGSISFMDTKLAGLVEVTYQTIGGAWAFNDQTLLQRLIDSKLNPRTTTWEEVVELPFQFPPIDHEWDVIDLTGMTDVVSSIDLLTEAVKLGRDQEVQPLPTPAQIGAYTIGEVDSRLGEKLGVNTPSVDSNKFGGRTVQEWETMVNQSTGVDLPTAMNGTFTQLIVAVDQVTAKVNDGSLRAAAQQSETP